MKKILALLSLLLLASPAFATPPNTTVVTQDLYSTQATTGDLLCASGGGQVVDCGGLALGPIIPGQLTFPYANGGGGSPSYNGTLQQTLTYLNSLGGGRAVIPAATNITVTTPLDLLKGTYIDGACPTTQNDSSPPFLECSRLRAGANIAAVVTQANLSTLLHSAGLSNLTLDGNAANFTTTAVLSVSPVNSYFDKIYVTNGTGDCVDHLLNPTAAWIDWYINSTIQGCTGVGLNFQGSDSHIYGNYISGNGTNVLLNTTGASIFALNDLDLAGGDALVMENSSVAPFQVTAVVGNFFTQNTTSDIHLKVGSGSVDAMRSAIVGNIFHDSTGILVDANVSGGLIAGDYFSAPTSAYDISFNGTGNTGFQIIGTSHTLSPSARFVNLPSDTQVISGGPGGVFNRLGSLILGTGVTTADAALDAYGSATVLSQANTVARFGVNRNSSGLDTALLVGSISGNTPFLAAVAGETTALVRFEFFYGGSELWEAKSNLFNIVAAGSAAAPSLGIGNATTGLYSVSTTGLGLSVNGVLKGDYGISNASDWTFPNLVVTGSFTATGLVTNADLANPATTVNGQTCTLGSTCTVGGGITSVSTGLTVSGGALSSNATDHVSFQPGLMTSVSNAKAAFHKFSKASTVDNIEGSAQQFSCTGNPTITMYECGTSTTCATPTTIGSVTVTAAATVVDGTVSNPAITAGDYVAFAVSAGTCVTLDVALTAQSHSN